MNYKSTGVYLWTNLKNEKVYVGSSSRSIAGRRDEHLSNLRRGTHSNKHFQRAWNKYGWDSFLFTVLEECSPSLCVSLEQEWMDCYKSYNQKHGYNIAPTAGSNLGLKMSAKTKKKQSMKWKTRWADPDSRAKLISSLKKAANLPEVKEKLKASRTPSVLAKQSLKVKTLWQNSKYRERILAAQEAAAKRPDVILKRKKMNDSPKIRAKRSEILKTVWGNPELRAKITLAMKGKHSGQASWSAKLTDDKVRDIHKRLQKGFTCSSLAKEFGVADPTILSIAKGKAWKYLELPPLKHKGPSKKGSWVLEIKEGETQ